ncbi:unnamed protein product [Schistosoma spindalis]|nr:unnamed protein product [Schistosoma spindale]
MFHPCFKSIIFFSIILLVASLLSLCILYPILWLLITKETRFYPGSMIYNEWLQPSIPIYIQFYIFNLTNPIEFQSGHKPTIQQLGPYTYIEKRLKFNITQINESITYKEIKWYYFDSNLSNGTENDLITTVNFAYVTIATKFKEMPWLLSRIMEQIEKYFHEYLFIKKPIKQLLWGYNDELLTFISNHFINITTNIGLFINKNNTPSDDITMDTGLYNSKMIGKILKYHGNNQLTYWKSFTANMINGSDGSLFHTFLNKNDQPYIFASDICRSIQFTMDSIVKLNDLPVLKFIPMLDTFKSSKYYEKNKGFCLNWPNCYDDGVLDMSSCQPGIPIAVSQPHFLNANQSYQNAIDGIHPTDELNTIIYIEPLTGYVIKAEKKLQLNLFIENNKKFQQLENISTILLPIMFMNESIQLNHTIINQLYYILIQKPYIATIILIIISTLFIVIICFIIAIYCYQTHRNSSVYTRYINDEDNNNNNNNNQEYIQTNSTSIENIQNKQKDDDDVEDDDDEEEEEEEVEVDEQEEDKQQITIQNNQQNLLV